MSSTLNISYSSSTAITITLNSLAASATVGRQATVIDNSSNLYDDAELTIIVKTSASALAAPKTVYIYLSGSEDGTNFDQDSAVMGASDAAYTIDSPSNLVLAGIINCSTSSKVYNKVIKSVAAAFGGTMPRAWTVIITNQTGQSLASSGNSASYSGVTYTSS